MSDKQPLHVIIAGGGIGGLALAQGLHKAGVRVSVYEKTVRRTGTVAGLSRAHQPVRQPPPSRTACPRTSTGAFVASGGKGRTTASPSPPTSSEQLLTIEPELSNERLGHRPEHRHYGVSRITLRQILLAGLPTEVVHFDKASPATSSTADGTVTGAFRGRQQRHRRRAGRGGRRRLEGARPATARGEPRRHRHRLHRREIPAHPAKPGPARPDAAGAPRYA